MKAQRRKLSLIFALCFFTLVPLACRTEADMTPTGRPVESDVAVASYSSFGIDLYLKTAALDTTRNVFISPASVAFALAMTWNGSAGETQAAMARTLRLPTEGFTAVNAADSALIAGMNAEINKVELDVANSLWARKGIEFKKQFLARNERFYGAEIRTLDFADPASPGVINAWVSEKTKDKIREIVDSIDPSSLLFLVNAIYFKGAWTKEFDPNATKEEIFHAQSGDAPVHMMHQPGTFPYREGDDFQAVRLPYGDGRIAMYVFLPYPGSDLEAFHAKLTIGNWKTWMGEFANRNGRLGLPRFKIEYEKKLKRPLMDLGMGIAFDGAKADFTGMLTAPGGARAYIHDVIHKTFCEVNEEGTEAAAVTSVEMRLTSAMEPMERFEMICDRPFFYAIVDNETGLILFMGALRNPS